jgi:hypothetical protein
MSAIATNEPVCVASGRYSKRKRTQVNYHMDELDVSDTESDFECAPVKVRDLRRHGILDLTMNRSVKLPHQNDNLRMLQRVCPRAKSFPSYNYPPKSAT